VVRGCKPDSGCWYVVAIVAIVIVCASVWVDSAVVLPHSNHAVPALPVGLMIPFSTAALDVTDAASFVATLGAVEVEVADDVVKLCAEPYTTAPPAYRAAARK
jgi:hypothetical protein